jgi:UDP-2-acetamido-2,6-beta-L-arabino-hexul-4-ose reductase
VWADKRTTAFVDIVYQNLFGELGRPDYNSFVATFCHRLATGSFPVIRKDRSVELIHAQDAAQVVIDQLACLNLSVRVETSGIATTVTDVAVRLQRIAATYGTGALPDLTDPFTLRLFNTYRSYLFPHFYPHALTVSSDERGGFVTAAQSSGGRSQASFSTTRPGVTRGNHFHLRKVERFVVLRGHARIAIRPVFGTRVDAFNVSGDSPAFVDMPTLFTHNITNVGDDDLYTLFWTNETYDPEDTDTFVAQVE